MQTEFSKACLILLSCIFSLSALGQEGSVADLTTPDKKWTVALAAGASLPLGDFADKNTDSYKSGLAMAGLSTRLKGSYRINRAFFTEINLLWFYNPCDADGLLDDLTDNKSPGPQFKVTTYPWQVTGVTAGIGTSFDMNEKTLFNLKGMLGVVGGKYSKRVEQSYDGNKTFTETKNAETTYSVAINLGFELQYSLTNHFGITFGGDYFNTELKYNDVSIVDSDNQKKSRGPYTQPVSVFQFSAGIFAKF